MKQKLWLLLIGLLAVAYVGSYIALSINGKYVEKIGGAADGSASWFPYGTQDTTPSPTTGRVETEFPNGLGLFYLPLLIIDRLLLHPDTPGIWD